MERKIDMHIHSCNSDGEYEVLDLVKMIKEKGIGIFSITDHDSIRSVEDIKMCDLSELDYIPGVEISSIYKGIKMHILGYDFEVNNSLRELISRIQEKRLKRFFEVIELIKVNEGICLQDEIIEQIIVRSESLARPHIIKALMDLGYGSDRDQVYRAFVKNNKSSINYRAYLEDAIDVLKMSNAKIILAHPKEIEDEYKIDIDSILPELLDLGVDGIEVYNSIHTMDDIKRYKEYVDKYKIHYTGGSDYHGPNVKRLVSLGNCSKEGMQVNKISLR